MLVTDYVGMMKNCNTQLTWVMANRCGFNTLCNKGIYYIFILLSRRDSVRISMMYVRNL